MFGKKKGFGKQANDEGVNFDFTGGQPEGEPTPQPEGEPTPQPEGGPTPQPQDITPEGDEGNPTPEVDINNEPEGDEGEPTPTPEGSDSSLTPRTPEGEPTPTPTVEPVEVTEEMILKSLSEKLGREVTSFDDLTPTNPLEEDEYVKNLLEWRKKTGRPIEDYVKFQKNYDEVSDIDVAREFLQIEYPSLSQDEVEFELERNFISSDDDLDDDVKLKNLELKKYASKGRNQLKQYVSELGEANPKQFTPEVQEQLEFAKQVQEQIKTNELAQQEYVAASTEAVKTIDSIKLNLSDDVALDFKVETPTEQLSEMVLNAPHWKNEDGSTNHQEVAKDAAILANFEKMLQLAYEQGVNSGTDQVIKDAKNTNLTDTVQGAAQPQGKKGIEVEGLDNYLGKKGMSIRRFKR